MLVKRGGGMIGIVDYGMGNLRSVAKAIEKLGGRVYVGDRPGRLAQADKLILPGVGAFGAAMEELKRRRLIDVLGRAVRERKYLLGICLGLQLFFERSEEAPRVKGLGFWKGSVVRFRTPAGKNLRIPHMGWNQVRWKKRSRLTRQVPSQGYFYFVHSYYARPDDPKLVIGECRYGVRFPAVLAAGRLLAVQFHPEKSQEAGLGILKNFIRLP